MQFQLTIRAKVEIQSVYLKVDQVSPPQGMHVQNPVQWIDEPSQDIWGLSNDWLL